MGRLYEYMDDGRQSLCPDFSLYFFWFHDKSAKGRIKAGLRCAPNSVCHGPLGSAPGGPAAGALRVIRHSNVGMLSDIRAPRGKQRPWEEAATGRWRRTAALSRPGMDHYDRSVGGNVAARIRETRAIKGEI